MSKRILVIAAHPDDEVLGCGGASFGHTEAGDALYIAILGEGITSRFDSRDAESEIKKNALHENCRKAADMMGAADLFTYNLPDNRFDSIPLLDVVKPIEKIICQIKPQEIYTHSAGDLNIDHVITHRAVITATRPMADCPVSDVYAFEVPSATDWAFQQFQPVFKPNVFVDISRSIDDKIEAMICYEGESRPFPHPRSSEAIRSSARRWGSVAGLAYAEAFELIRSVRRCMIR